MPRPEIVYGSATPDALPADGPVQAISPVPDPFTMIDPSVALQVVGFVNVPSVITGTTDGFEVADALGLIHPPTVCVTVYVPAEGTVMDAVVSPVDQINPEPVAESTELPQLLATVTTGAEGTGVVVKVMLAQVKAASLTHPDPSSPLT